MTPVNDIMILLEGLGEGAHQTLSTSASAYFLLLDILPLRF